MRRRLSTIMAILVALSMVFIAGPVMAGDKAIQTVSFVVGAVVSDASTTYSITSTAGTDNKKITASINTALPSGVTLKINLAAPTGATSLGDVDISNATNSVDVVKAIDSIAESGKTITYKLGATVDAAMVSDSKTVTLTIADS